MKLSKPAFVGAVSLLLSLSTNAALVAVDLDGNTNNGHEGVYDDVLDITWLADANLANTNDFGIVQNVTESIGIYGNGYMYWPGAEAYTSAMNAANNGIGYLGVNTWRQPTASGNCQIFNCGNQAVDTEDELGYHHYQNFGATDSDDILNGTNTNNLALFSNIQSSVYWTGTEAISFQMSRAFIFATTVGYQDNDNKYNSRHYVWAVADGNVAANAVPVPSAAWLFCSALLVLFGMRRR